MLFRKLFQVLVVGGAVMGATSGCSTPASNRQPTLAKGEVEEEWLRRRGRQGPRRARRGVSGARCRRRRRSRGLVGGAAPQGRRSVAFRTRVEREAARRFARLAAGIAAFDADSPVPALMRQAADDEYRHAALCADLSAVYGQPVGAAGEDAAIAPGSLGPRAAVLYEVVASCCITETESVATLTTLLAEPVEPRVERVSGRSPGTRSCTDASAGRTYRWRHRISTSLSFPWIPAMLAGTVDEGVRRRGRRFWKAANSCARRASAFAQEIDLHRTLEGVVFPGLEKFGISSQPARQWVEARNPGAGASWADVGGLRWPTCASRMSSDAGTRSPPSPAVGRADRRLFRAGAAQRQRHVTAHPRRWFVRALAGLRRAGRCLGIRLRFQAPRPGRVPVGRGRRVYVREDRRSRGVGRALYESLSPCSGCRASSPRTPASRSPTPASVPCTRPWIRRIATYPAVASMGAWHDVGWCNAGCEKRPGIRRRPSVRWRNSGRNGSGPAAGLPFLR